jgi:hypothetical protein
MLKIEKIKEEILNFDTDVTADELLSCWLHELRQIPLLTNTFAVD